MPVITWLVHSNVQSVSQSASVDSKVGAIEYKSILRPLMVLNFFSVRDAAADNEGISQTATVRTGQHKESISERVKDKHKGSEPIVWT